MIVRNASKTYTNGPKRRNYHSKKGARVLYFYDEDGNFHTKRVSFIKWLYYRYLVSHHKVLTSLCAACGSKFRYIDKPQCPKCI